MEFINLKLHTDYSLLEGVGTVEKYVEKAKQQNAKYLGVTDTSMFSAIKFYNSCKKNNITPILGIELFTYGYFIQGEHALTVYGIGYEGYKELVRLSTVSYSRYVSTRPIIDIQDIKKNSSKLVVIAGGINSELLKAITEMEFDFARKIIKNLKETFKNLYIEIPAFKLNKREMEQYIRLITEMNVEYVITNDVYYVEKDDSYLQVIVSSIKENVPIQKVKNAYKYDDLYLKNIDTIKQDLEILDEEMFNIGILNAEKIASMCSFEIPKNEFKFPKLELEISEKEYLRELVIKCLNKKYENITEEIEKRFEYELDVIDNMGFNGYFLVVADIVKYANDNDILIGPGRGSASGSIVAYALDITKVDPIKYDLIFERFLNIGRKSMPDIDIDFEPSRRDEVVQYLMRKYKKEYVSNIIVFSRLQEKQLQKDLERVLDKNRNLIPYALKKLEGNVRHSSIHPSGVVISKYPLIEEVPTYKDDKLNINVTQYQMEELEDLGLLKIDILALKNLEIIKQTINKVGIKLEDIDLEDKKTFDTFNSGNTLGVFQAESQGMVDLITKFKVESFLDISAILALYRPGPLNSGMTYEAIKRKHSDNIEYIFSEIESILKETYGIIVYQEQIMKIASIIAGYTLLEADELRKAISKKKIDILKLHKDTFIKKAVERGYDENKVQKLYSQIESFGGYGFNKSHTIPYSMLCYYTAYLKTNYTLEYMCSLLNNDINDYSKLKKYVIELKKYKYEIERPSINKSDAYFSIKDNKIIYALYSIKGISENIAKSIVDEREINGKYTNIDDFCYRMIKYDLTKKHIEALANAGVFDEFLITRREVNENSEEIYNICKKNYENSSNVGRSLFLVNPNEIFSYNQKNMAEYTESELIAKEIDSIGLLLSIDLTKKVNELLKVINLPDNIGVGVVLAYEVVLTRKREKMMKISIDENGSVQKYVIFSSLYNKISEKVFKNKVCIFEKDENIIRDIEYFENIDKLKDVSLNILIDKLSEEQKIELKKQFNEGGFAKINFYENRQRLKNKHDIYCKITNEFIKNIARIIDYKNIRVNIRSMRRITK